MPKVRIRVRPIEGEAPDITPEHEGTDQESSIADLGKLAVGGGALVGGALLARKPSLIGKAANWLNAARQQVMLTGMAVPKSFLGNTGAAFVEAAERKSTAPLKEFFSRQTLKDAAAEFKANPNPYPGSAQIPGWTPGRIMNAMDQATQKAFVRAGLTPEAAQKAVLQAPLTGNLGQALDSPAARYLIPFRRTPFNQFIEGLETIKGQHPRVLAAAGAAGAAHGAATSDDRYPVTLGLGTAFAGRYALPYSLAALMGRYAAGGRTDAGIAGAVLPVSEYGLTTGIEDPLQPFRRPAALTALERIAGGR